MRQPDPALEAPAAFSLRACVLEGKGDGPVHVVEAFGEVDLHTAPELRAELVQLIEGGARTVVVDFSGASFLDSTTLGVLLGAIRRLQPLGGELLVVCGNRSLRKIFEITQLEQIMHVVDNVDEAVERAGQPLEEH